MTELHTHAQEYLIIRRAMGYKLKEAGQLLEEFVLFAEEQGASFITTDLALRWATKPTNVHPSRWGKRYGTVRLFAEYHRSVDSRTEIPPRGLLSQRLQRKTPYIYSEDEIQKIINAAQKLSTSKGLRPHTYSTYFGLLAVTGMRASEAINIERRDVDLARNLLTVRETKFTKSRIIPIHISTQQILQEYAHKRDQIFRKPLCPNFFVNNQGTQLKYTTTVTIFLKLLRQIGLRKDSGECEPTLHALRHSFAVRTLINWYRTNLDIEKELPKLSTYLGHTHVRHTYWYLTAVPELLQLATLRLENSKEYRK